MNEFYLKKLADTLDARNMDAMLISPGEELQFLLGFSPMLCERFQGLFVKRSGEAFYICNLLYREQLQNVLPKNVPIYSWFDGDVMTEVVEKILREQGLLGKTIAVASTVQAFNVLEIQDKMDVIFQNGKPLMEEMRMLKTPEELDALREAAKIADQVMMEALNRIRPGVSEGEIGDFLLARMTELGGDRAECIVAFDGNAGYPHYLGRDGILGEKGSVLMDFGCTVRGMYADTTRTVFLGEPTQWEREVYELVRRSNEEAEQMVCEGAFVPDIDRKARQVLGKYADTLINRLGHGIGYTIHESPDIKQSNPIYLQRGMAFSVEPGVYYGGKFGVRIEDILILNENGEREVLNQTPKELIVL